MSGDDEDVTHAAGLKYLRCSLGGNAWILPATAVQWGVRVENARIIDSTSTELHYHWGGGNFVYNRHGLDFAEDAGSGPSSPVRKGRRRRE